MIITDRVWGVSFALAQCHILTPSYPPFNTICWFTGYRSLSDSSRNAGLCPTGVSPVEIGNVHPEALERSIHNHQSLIKLFYKQNRGSFDGSRGLFHSKHHHRLRFWIKSTASSQSSGAPSSYAVPLVDDWTLTTTQIEKTARKLSSQRVEGH